jgi:hypothetical protein
VLDDANLDVTRSRMATMRFARGIEKLRTAITEPAIAMSRKENARWPKVVNENATLEAVVS